MYRSIILRQKVDNSLCIAELNMVACIFVALQLSWARKWHELRPICYISTLDQSSVEMDNNWFNKAGDPWLLRYKQSTTTHPRLCQFDVLQQLISVKSSISNPLIGNSPVDIATPHQNNHLSLNPAQQKASCCRLVACGNLVTGCLTRFTRIRWL